MAELGHVAILLMQDEAVKKNGRTGLDKAFIVGRSTCIDLTQTSDAIG